MSARLRFWVRVVDLLAVAAGYALVPDGVRMMVGAFAVGWIYQEVFCRD